MIKFAKLVNEETGLCEVGIGDNTAFYKSVGMVELDVEKSEIDGQWYLAEKLNTDKYKEQLAELNRQNKKIEIKQQLEAIDIKSIRALRAGETENLAAYEVQAEELRKQLNSL